MRTAKQTGSSLVEVMVALFVLAIGLLGILAMQSKSMQYNQSAHVYSQAVYLANDIAERIRLNAGQASAYVGDYDGERQPPSTACIAATCDAGGLVTWDKREWNNLIGNTLPAGKAKITDTGAGAVKIEVSFDDSRSEGSETETRKTYALVVGL
jgi:type IV pilus assembly protein PilV